MRKLKELSGTRRYGYSTYKQLWQLAYRHFIVPSLGFITTPQSPLLLVSCLDYIFDLEDAGNTSFRKYQ
jgi:hypothetical protein